MTPKPSRLRRAAAAIAFSPPGTGLVRLAGAAIRAWNGTSVNRTAGGGKGTLGNWRPRRDALTAEGQSRELIATRGQDIAANDPHGASVVGSMRSNIAGTGIGPQSQPVARALGITTDQAREFQWQAEWAWRLWCREADYRRKLPFWALQRIVVWNMVVNGEFVALPVMDMRPHERFGLKIQALDPLRLRTPSDMTRDGRIRDGVELGQGGDPVAYWLANPEAGAKLWNSDSTTFTRIPSRAAHRPGFFHLFDQAESEQVRGVSCFAPSMKTFRDLSDYLDYELVGAIVAAQFAYFIERPYGVDANGAPWGTTTTTATTEYEEFEPGQVLYGNPGEKPHELKNSRPGETFEMFTERVLRGIGASIGLPYEVVDKNFSKTNYSSARAALLEAWRMFAEWQRWLVDSFCQPVWEMVLEEAWLRDMIVLPKGAPDFYEGREAWCNARWIPPRRGHVDPVKEIEAQIAAMNAGILTLADLAAEQGLDWESQLEMQATIMARKRELGLSDPEPAATPAQGQTDEDDSDAEPDA